MGYPGDQGKPGGWPAEGGQASPYDAPWKQDRADLTQPASTGAPYRTRQGNGFPGPPRDDDPYAPPPNVPYSPGGSFRSPGGFGDDTYGGAYEEGPGMPGPNRPDQGMHGPGMPEPGMPGPGGGMPRERRRLPLIVGGAAAAGLLLVGGGVVLSSMLRDDSSAKAGNASANPAQSPAVKASPTQPTLEPVKLKSRATDPSALSLKEAFGKAAFTGSGKKYVRTAWHIHRSCTGAVEGAKLSVAMKRGRCTQVLRATYARRDGLLVGTVGVFNLETEGAAKLAQRAATAKDAFLKPLRGAGYSKTIGRGEALGTAEARGHYLVMTWVQRPDGKRVATKYHSVVSTFGQHLIRGSGLSFALHYRETEGKPFQN
ncbi:hypothetical protein [Actinomadura sp. SCN-SB]|uniref:hypothetical protein n=1 Tax=Actinomadura sp. SCN-SB TaxID=3373092 RepID=UPI003751AFCE